MYETSAELDRLQAVLDASAAGAGPHLRSIITDERRIDAAQLCRLLSGMRLITVATTTADSRPIAGPVDGYFLHGSFWFATSPDSVRARHLARRPAISATHVPDDRLGVSVHGTAELYEFPSESTVELRQAMLDHYLPVQGPSFETWLDGLSGAVGVRVEATKVFTYHHAD